MRFVRRILFVALASASCTNSEHPGGPIAPPAFLRNTRVPGVPVTIADHFTRLSERDSGFTGVFFDENAELTIAVAEDDFSDDAKERVAAWARSYSGATTPTSAVNLRRVKYSYALLRTRYADAMKALRVGDALSSTWIDETKGMFRVGVTDRVAVSELTARLRDAGFPAEMFSVEYTGPVHGETTLNQTRRPTIGGLEYSHGGLGCSIGFNVFSWNTGTSPSDPKYFLTAAHCAGSAWGSVTGKIAYQDSTQRVGVEYAAAPKVHHPNWRCPEQVKSPCNEGDVAVIRYDDTVSVLYGNVADVDLSKNITGYFNVQGTVSGVLTGQTITKVGGTTGKTNGTVLASCVDVAYSIPQHPTAVWLICGQKADYNSSDGDSGAPVFRPFSASDPYTPSIGGIHAAVDGSGNRYFTPITQVDLIFFGEFYYQ